MKRLTPKFIKGYNDGYAKFEKSIDLYELRDIYILSHYEYGNQITEYYPTLEYAEKAAEKIVSYWDSVEIVEIKENIKEK